MVRPRRTFQRGLLLAALAALSACASTPKTSEQRVRDKETVAAVQSALDAHTYIYTKHITIEADDGVVHLGGYVWSDFDMYEAQRLAESAPGVTKVINDMELELEGMGDSPVSR